MWFCTTSLDQLLDSALCWRGQRSFWSLSPAGLLRSSPPGSPPPPPQTATCPSDRPNQLLSSQGHTLTQHQTNHSNLTVSLIVHLQRHHLKIHKMPFVSQVPQNVSSQRDGSPDCLLKDTQTASQSHTRRSNGPGASSLREESCCRARSRCPSSSITWCPSTGSTSTRGPSGSSVSTTAARPETSNRCGGL